MKRIDRLFDILPDDVDTVIVFNESSSSSDKNFFFYTGLVSGLFEGSFLVMERDGRITAFVPKLEELTAKSAYSVDVVPFDRREILTREFRERLKKSKKIGIDFHRLSHAMFLWLDELVGKNSTFADVGKYLNKVRLIKDSEEIERIEKACRIAAETADLIPGFLHRGITENQLAAEINHTMQLRGSGPVAFETIVAFGASSAEPHYMGGGREVRVGDIVLCDFGGTVDKYCSDITRTFFFGEPDEMSRRMYEVVLQGAIMGMEAVAPGEKASGIHNIVEKFINETEFKGAFIHPLGHTLGLDAHDGGRISSASDIILEPGMVFTIEPGVYIPGKGGIRLENDIVVTNDGYRNLTQAKMDLSTAMVKF